MHYTCIDCGKVVNISRLDVLKQRCPDCDLVISSGSYEQNISGGLTLFATTGENLGHVVISEGLFRFYCDQNPDENIIFLNPIETKDILHSDLYNRADKIMWAEVSNIVNAPKDKRVIHYNLARECSKLAERGHYPKWYDFETVEIEDYPFIVLHLRNIHGNPEKNVTPDEAKKIFEMLSGHIVYLVGNDQPFYDIETGSNIINMRGKLTAEQTAWLCGHNNCIATIGKDSGPMHLAAASGGRVIAYGYQSNRLWVPKAKPGMVMSFVNGHFEDFIEYLDTELCLD